MDGNWERVICFFFFGCFPSCCCLVFSPLFLLLPLSLLSLIVVSLDLAVSARGAHWVFRFGTAAAVLFGFCCIGSRTDRQRCGEYPDQYMSFALAVVMSCFVCESGEECVVVLSVLCVC